MLFTHLNHVACDFQIRGQQLNRFACDSTCGNAAGGFPGGGTATTTIISNTVFHPIGNVGVTGAEFLNDVAIVFGTLISVFY